MGAAQQVEAAVTLDDVVAASERIRELVHKTPVLNSRLFDQAAGLRAVFKCENLQRGGAFKLRGAFNFLLQLNSEERKRGVVTFSSGNHAQAVAIAAAHLGVKATIVMPTDAPSALKSLRHRPTIRKSFFSIVCERIVKNLRLAFPARVAR